MNNFQVINSIDHVDTMVITQRGAEYGDAMMSVQTFPFEFRNVQAEYPILFHKGEQDKYHPVAMLGFEQGENLFLQNEEWDAAYIPAMIRREPFMIHYQDGGADGIDSRMVALDMDHPRVTGVGGERLFDQGKRSSYLEEIAGLLEALYEGAVHVEQFIDALETHQLIENVTLEVKLNNGSTNQLLGYAALNEDRIQSLSGDELAALNNAGFLMPMFMVLASIAQMRGLIDRKNDKVQRAQDVPAF